jgi:hypothetical protein
MTDKRDVAEDYPRSIDFHLRGLPTGEESSGKEVLMQRHCHDGSRKKSVRLSPSVEALECRQLLSVGVPVAPLGLGDGMAITPAPDNGMVTLPRPFAATEVIKAHQVVAFRFRIVADEGLPPTGDVQQYSLETRKSVRLHRHDYGRLVVPLASVTYDQADSLLTLTPIAPAPVGRYRLVKPGTFFSIPLPRGQTNWYALIGPPSSQRGHGSSSDWYDWLNPMV